MKPLLIVLVAAVIAACSGPGDAKTFSVGDITVVDESGLVTDVQPAEAPPVDQLSEPVATKGESLTQVIVAWAGSSCIHDWMLRLAGNALVLTIEPGTAISGCEGVLAANAVRLDLNRVVEAADIDVSLAGG